MMKKIDCQTALIIFKINLYIMAWQFKSVNKKKIIKKYIELSIVLLFNIYPGINSMIIFILPACVQIE